ncbi:hypothetical protein SAMN05421823_11558 [Catalinimonas alkaloidigena]|uniref:Uncharacterized protein n=1 Tax=Catalinimonas alkaloidigena TaxID=1075417 RepID=A0A1G9U1C4_9BACT|nr:hypothetical protein [Catalinimonas alkaloidigena]SDM53817.1 hypothetical protein SAMN05421823_11558 [Catalinimonas alkaloidigena]
MTRFTLPDALNVPFQGGPDDELNTLRLRYLKKELRENPAVKAGYIRQGVQAFLPGMQKLIDRLPKGSQLLITPSASNTNRIPVLLAVAMQKQRPDLQLINLREKMVRVLHETESKVKDNYAVRAVDPRRYRIHQQLVQRASVLHQAPLYLLDDSISEGDTTMMLHRELSRAGIHAQGGILTAVARERYHVRTSDLTRLYEKLLPHCPKDYSREALAQELYQVFAGFPRKKLLNFERSCSIGSLRKHPLQAFDFLRQTATYLVAASLDPHQVVQRLAQFQASQVRAESPERKRGVGR